jgi:adenylate kinase
MSLPSSVSRVVSFSRSSLPLLIFSSRLPSRVASPSFASSSHRFFTTTAAPASSSSSPSSSSPSSEVELLPSDFAPKAEVKDAEIIFRSVWSQLLKKYGEENLSFPPSIVWLAGAPGSGKGTAVPKILEHMGITAKPIEVSSLLTGPEIAAIKARGDLVDDRKVVTLLLETLLKPEYSSGCLVDGFIRSRVQAECCKLLFDQMQLLRAKYALTDQYFKFRRPVFHIVVLYIDREQSIRRQIHRGQQAQQHNERVTTIGIGTLETIRETDVNPSLAEERYKQFKSQVYESLKEIKDKFSFHFINADGGPESVQERILHELKYQSSLELADETFERVKAIPLAAEIIRNARYELVRRLDDYRSRQSELFDRVIGVIQMDFMHILRRQGNAGKAIIRSSSPLFAESGAIDMALDLLSERGFTAVLDVQKVYHPYRFDLSTGLIESKEKRVYEFHISFPPPTIRRL